MMKGTYFVSGIDTNIGKSIVTGYLAKNIAQQGISVTTQKMIQTGNTGYSEDIDLHRKIMGVAHTQEDKDFITAPCIRSYPCSPHLAARLDNNPIDLEDIYLKTKILENKYQVVLLEGAGGLMVPTTDDQLTIDYIAQHHYPLIFVSCGKLGSLNHTLLNLEAIKNRNINLYKFVYNRFPHSDAIIEEDSLKFIKQYLTKHFPDTVFEVIDEINF